MARKEARRSHAGKASAPKPAAAREGSTRQDEAASRQVRSDVEQPVTMHAENAVPIAHPARRTGGEIAVEQLDREYVPAQAGLRESLHEAASKDRDYPGGTAERWNEEDRLTNRSGDPRIGTHGRSYEPGEPGSPTRK